MCSSLYNQRITTLLNKISLWSWPYRFFCIYDIITNLEQYFFLEFFIFYFLKLNNWYWSTFLLLSKQISIPNDILSNNFVENCFQHQRAALQMAAAGMKWYRSKHGPNHVPITHRCSKDCRVDYHSNSSAL